MRLPTKTEVLQRQYDLVYDTMRIFLLRRKTERPLGIVYRYLFEYATYLEDSIDHEMK